MPDYSFIANPTGQQQGMNTLSSLLQAKGQNIQNQSNQAVLTEQNNVRSQLQDPNFLKAITDPNTGDIDFTKAIPTILKIAPTQGASILQGMATAQTGATNAKGAILKLSGEQRSAVGQYLLSQANDPNATVQSVQSGLSDLTKQIPQLKPAADFMNTHFLTPNQDNPDAFRKGLLTAGQQVMTVPEQVTAQQPNYVDIGGNLKNQNPMAQNAPQTVDKTLPPTTEVATPEGGSNYLGSGGGKNSGSVPAKLPQQEISKNVNRQDVINTDWKTTVADAADAPMKLGVIQNMKSHMANAVMGQASDQRQVIAGYAQLLGMPAADIAKTSTDLLAKNAAMLANQSGNTDASRAIGALMNPNSHMTLDAGLQAANQVEAQIRIKALKQEYMQPFLRESGKNPDMYENALKEWNQNADPRTLQWSSLPPQQKMEMKAGMTPKERKSFSDQLQWMEDRGLAK